VSRIPDGPYLKLLVSQATQPQMSAIRAAIERDGRWQGRVEWRISTDTEFSIEPVHREGSIWYRVRVACDHEFTSVCPTLDRAIEFMGLYQGLIAQLFYEVGWPSWATRTQLNPK